MLETLGDENVYRMSVEESEKKPTGWFDVEKEISEAERQELLQQVKVYRHNREWREFLDLASDLQALGIDPGVTADDFIAFARSLDYKAGSWAAHGELLADAAHLGVEVFLLDEERKGLTSDFDDYAKENEWDFYLATACTMKVFNINFAISPKNLVKIHEDIDYCRNQNTWQIFAWMAANLKELGYDIAIDSHDQMKMKEALDGLRGQEAIHFSQMALNMKKLSDSEEKKLDHPIIKMPEQRKF